MKYTMEEIKIFTDACDNMINSKFILVNKRISDILKSIAVTPPVYNAIAESMINFNFSSAYTSATAKTGELSIQKEKLVAFVFCLLKAIDDRKVNINELLVRHFASADNSRTNYASFCEQLIVPFKQKIVDKLCKSQTKAAAEKSVQKPAISKAENDRLEFLVKDVKAYLSGLKKFKGTVSKQQYAELLDCFVLAIERGDYIYYNTFAQILNTLTKDKELKSRYVAILELCKKEDN